MWENTDQKNSEYGHFLHSEGIKRWSTLLLKQFLIIFTITSAYLTLSWRRPLSYRNQSIDLLRESMDWYLYDNGLRHERVSKTRFIWKNFEKYLCEVIQFDGSLV